MPHVSFTPNLQRHVECPPAEVAARSVREALDAVFAQNPALRGYVLDDRGALRKHVGVAVNGALVDGARALDESVGENDEIYVMQLLSGG
jgi:sulfur-carrier protein